MENSLQRYTTGDQIAPIRDMKVAKQAKQVHDEVRLSAYKADGAMALSYKLMQGVTELDARRRELTQGDPALDAMLMDIELTAVRQAREIQSNLYNGWGI